MKSMAREKLARAEGVPRHIINVSDMDPAWNWLATACADEPALAWHHCSSASIEAPRWLQIAGRHTTWARALNAREALARASPDALLVSHGPWSAMHIGLARRARHRSVRHLAYAFTFTHLPTGPKRAVMAHAFRDVDRFVSFCSLERQLYARHFDLDLARFDMQLWAAQPPIVQAGPPIVAGSYISAVGSQGRDYAPIIAAMRKLPRMRLVIVADPASVDAATLPDNVTLTNGISLAAAMNVIQHSLFTTICLRDAEVPCGHSTIVAAMHLGKAIACTDSSGVYDYLFPERTGLLVPSGDPSAWLHAIERLTDDKMLRHQLGAEAQAFARRNCSEDAAVTYLRRYLAGEPTEPGSPAPLAVEIAAPATLTAATVTGSFSSANR